MTVAAVILAVCAVVGLVWAAGDTWANRRLDRYYDQAGVPRHRARPYDWAHEPRHHDRCQR